MSNSFITFLTTFLTTTIGRLRLFAFLEGISLLVLVFIAVPLKHLNKNPILVQTMGPIREYVKKSVTLRARVFSTGRFNSKVMESTGNDH